MARAQVTYQPAPVAPRPGVRPRHVFISYSHRDGVRPGEVRDDMPRRFHEELLQLARNWPDFGVTAQTIFFDRPGLLPGDDWEVVIEEALARCDLFIFLASSQSLASPFCVKRELATALATGKRIVPVLLAECQWFDHLIEGDPKGRRLGRFDAVPKNEQTQPQPIATWADVDAAWARTMAQLKTLLASTATAAPEPPPSAAPGPGPVLGPMLPFACNQVQPETDFDSGIRAWGPQALLVLVKGEYDDHAAGFWDRLRRKNLLDLCGRSGLALLEERPVQRWPLDEAASDAVLAEGVRFALADALTGSRQGLPDAAALAAVLGSLGGVLPLQLSAPDAGPALGRTLRQALEFIEATPAGAPLQRLALAVLVEDKALADTADLARTLGLGGFARTRVVELTRLQAITPRDTRQWYEDHELEDHCELDREELVAEVFKGSPALRLRRFSKTVTTLLKLR